MNEGQQGAGSTGRTDPSKGLEPVHAEAFANFCSHLLGALNNGFRAHIRMFEPERGERLDTRASTTLALSRLSSSILRGQSSRI